MAYDYEAGKKAWWDQSQAEKALWERQQKVVIDREKMRFRYVDPNTGQYREMDEAEITAFQQHEQKKMVERIERERRDQENDEARFQQKQTAMERGLRDDITRQLDLAMERGDKSALVYWMEQLATLEGRVPIPGERRYDPAKDGPRYGQIEFKKQTTETKKMVPLHKAGHFPTQWMREAVERAEASDMCVTLTVERDGVLVTAIEADDRFDIRVTTWEAMEQNHVNPLLEAIDAAERKIKVLERLKARVQR